MNYQIIPVYLMDLEKDISSHGISAATKATIIESDGKTSLLWGTIMLEDCKEESND